LREVLTGNEREAVMQQYDSILPSLDLREALQLYAPAKSAFQVNPCESCGGTMEIIMRDSDEVERLKKLIIEGKEREARWRLKLATLDAQIETIGREKQETTKSHMEEVIFLQFIYVVHSY
jgi:hypothetical protein